MDKITTVIVMFLCFIAGFAAATVLDQYAHTGLSSGSTGENLPAAICQPLTITQTDGTAVSFPCMPRRIIAANANAAELLIALGAADRIVGATDSTLDVPYIRNKTPNAVSIGNWQTPNIEQMLALKPDVIIFRNLMVVVV